MTINNGCSKDDALFWKWTFVRVQQTDVSTRASAKSKLSQRDMSKEPETCHPLFAILVSCCSRLEPGRALTNADPVTQTKERGKETSDSRKRKLKGRLSDGYLES